MHISEYYEDIWRCGRCAYCGGSWDDDCCPSRFLSGFQSATGKGKMLIARAIMSGQLRYSPSLAENLYKCSLCGACEDICNVLGKLPLLDILHSMRADLFEAGLTMPRHKKIVASCKDNHNPYLERQEDKMRWLPKGKVLPRKGDVYFFMGCTAPYRNPELCRALIKTTEAAGVGVAVTPEEWCCGSVMLRIGARGLAEDLAKHNLEAIEQSGASTVVTHCPGCYDTLKMEYPRLVGDLPFEVLHVTELMRSLIDANRLRFQSRVEERVTYHDPCHLGRFHHLSVYDDSRVVLEAIGVKLVEMERTREKSWCCGAGGGLKSAFPDLAVKVAKRRIAEAEETGAKYLVTACPFCLRNLRDAVEAIPSTKIEVLDVLELASRALDS